MEAIIILRIGKLTLDGYSNYGNVLQSYALQEVLRNYGDVDCLQHEPQWFIPFAWWQRWGWKENIKFITNRHGNGASGKD